MADRVCWYCGEEIKPEDLCQIDNDGTPEDCHIHCSESLGISWTTEDGFDSDMVKEIKSNSKYRGYESYEILAMLRNGEFDDIEELEEE